MGFIGIVGAFATRAVVNANRLARKPASLSFLEAAAIPAASLTAWQALHEHGGLRAGQRVLIHAAAGGVGSAAVQLAKLAGADVTATASAGNRSYVQDLGAMDVIDYTQEDFAARTSKFDLVLDLVGGDTQARSWSVLQRGGVLVSTVSKPDSARGKDVGATGKNFAAHADGSLLARLAARYASGELRTHIDSVLPFSNASHALTQSMTGHVRGKVVLDMHQAEFRSRSGPPARG